MCVCVRVYVCENVYVYVYVYVYVHVYVYVYVYMYVCMCMGVCMCLCLCMYRGHFKLRFFRNVVHGIVMHIHKCAQTTENTLRQIRKFHKIFE